LHPSWFPEAQQAFSFLDSAQERLSFPVDYWNGLGALLAMGLPAVLHLASIARSIVIRALMAAAIPVIVLTMFFTLSRSGMAAGVVGLAAYLALADNRLPKLVPLAVGGAGGALLVVMAIGRDALRHGLLNSTAKDQGTEMLVATIVVCLAVGIGCAAWALFADHRERPSWTVLEPAATGWIVGVVSAAILIGFVAAGGPSRASDAWSDFKSPDNGSVRDVGRLSSSSGENRYQFWSSAVREYRSKPLTGTGSGTFQFWWTRDADIRAVVHDTHSLYLQTLGELGIVGLLILAAFLLVGLVGGAMRTAARPDRSFGAAAVAGALAFCVTASVDWMWQIPVLAVALLLLLAAALGSQPSEAASHPGFPWPGRIAILLLGLAAVAIIAVPLSSTALLRESQAAASEGDFVSSLAKAEEAKEVEPSAAGPRLQEALVLEARGEAGAAAAAAEAATEREPTNWRLWLVRSRLEAKLGEVQPAIRAYREARSLNPHSIVFSD
jgi:O-antigen ligase